MADSGLPDGGLPDGGPPGGDPPATGGPPYVEEAISADAVVREEAGRWIVYLDVVLASGAVRRRVGDHPDRRRADQAARIIERNARRHIRPAGFQEGPGRAV